MYTVLMTDIMYIYIDTMMYTKLMNINHKIFNSYLYEKANEVVSPKKFEMNNCTKNIIESQPVES